MRKDEKQVISSEKIRPYDHTFELLDIAVKD